MDTTNPVQNVLASASAQLPLRTPAPRRQLSATELATLRPIVQRLYIEEGSTLGQVIRILQQDHNYNPTPRQLRILITKWGFKKNTSKGDRQKIMAEVTKKDYTIFEGKVGTVSLNVEKLKRWEKEAKSGEVMYPAYNTDRSFRVTPRLSQQPVNPAPFHTSESLLYHIESFMEGLIDSKLLSGANVNTSTESRETARPGTELSGDLDMMIGGINSAKKLILAQSFVEGRKLLSRAFSFIRAIIQEQDPLALGYVFIVYVMLMKTSYSTDAAILDLFRNYASNMADIVIPNKHHPWRRILNSLATIERDQLEGTLNFSLDRLADVHNRKLGPYHTLSVVTRTNALTYNLRSNPRDEERILRELIDGCEAIPGSSEQLAQLYKQLVRNVTQQNRLDEADEIASRFVVMAINNEDNVNAMANALGSRSLVRYKLGNQTGAEADLRLLVHTLVSNSGTEPDFLMWAISYSNNLEMWLREWGRANDADEVKKEAAILIERQAAEEELEYELG